MGAIAKAATAPLLLLAAPAFAVSPAVGEREFPTYGYFDPCPVPLVKKAHYPYCRFDGTSAKASPKKWKTVTLENGNIRVTATPEIGGKIWGAVDKASGHDFIYFNDVVKFRDIAMRGPWCSGGIEFNFGVIGHAPWTASPVDWFVRENGDGSASYFAAGDEYITRAKWQVEVRLQEGADHFETYVDWFNASGLPSPYYHWMNAAFPIGENPSFLFPGSHYSGHGGEIASWPVDPEGRHLDVYRENAFGTAKSCHVLPGDASVYGIWWPELGMGAVHRSEAWEKFGRKIFLWALSREGGIWEDLLTDSNGQYAELQSGRYFLQPGWEAYATPFKHPVLAPGSSERFEESWGVLRRREDLREDGPSPVGRPLAAPEGFDWDGAYGLYVRGSQHFAMGDDLAEAERLLNASLALAPDFAPALDALAAIEMRRGDYAAVHALCRRALAVSTVDEDANYLDGYAYFAEGDDVSARDRLGMATFGTKNRSAAYALIARTFLRSGESEKALKAADKSLASNAWNLDALLVKTIVDREAAKGILAQYPLFHAVRRELEGDSFREFVRNENPNETYVEIGSWYEESGLFDRAAEMYSFAPESPIAMIRLAYLKRDVSMLSAAAALPVDGVAPFRRETLPALRWAAGNSGDWRFRYYLAVLLSSFAKDTEAVKLLDSCADEPDSAVFYLFRSLFRSGAGKYRDLVLAKSHGDSWRVGRQMCDYFAAGGDLARYLSVAAGYVKKYPLCNPLQLAYADALEKNGRYDECLSFLRGVTILPSEFSGGATAIWQRAQKALGMEPTWPENLGQGEPY